MFLKTIFSDLNKRGKKSRRGQPELDSGWEMLKQVQYDAHMAVRRYLPIWGRAGVGLLCIALLVSCGLNNDSEEKAKYDPTKPTILSSFYPDEGKFQEKVMLTGDNMPTDPSMVRVYFNQRRAPMIGGTTERMYVQAPRLPGNAPGYDAPRQGVGHCQISVVIGGDSLVYADTFLYEETITVTTVAGNGDLEGFQEGALANAILQPRFICCDKDGNVFIANRSTARSGGSDMNLFLCRLNEEENIFTRLRQGTLITNIPCADPITGVVSVATETTVGSFITADPNEFWAPREREMKWINPSDRPAGVAYPNAKHCMVVNPSDGYIYTRWNAGHIVRINQTTFEAEMIARTGNGDAHGLTFRPGEPNILYMSFVGNANELSNGIYSIDVSDPEPINTLKRLNSPATGGGHRDGDLSIAQFRQPRQIFCDTDGFIYIADSDNHCIRRITPENQVETVLGIPGTPGWKDGTRAEAQFRDPYGIAISSDGSVYVADLGNARLRKLSVN